MRLYHISELEQLSGIKSTTIRVWERRYNLIRPGRTDTNIRMYDDSQVRKLLNVSTLLASGVKISHIAEMSEPHLHAAVLELQESREEGDDIALAYINDMVASMLIFDENGFELIFNRAVKKYGLFKAMLTVIYPLLQKIGLMWSVEDAMPVQEHFASAVIRRKLLAATDALKLKRNRRKKFLLMLPPGEWHEIGLLFANYIIRSKDIETVYLGQNVPYEQVSMVTEKIAATHLLLFFTTRPEEESLPQIRKRMRLAGGIQLLAAGNAEVLENMKAGPHSQVLYSPQDLLQFL